MGAGAEEGGGGSVTISITISASSPGSSGTCCTVLMVEGARAMMGMDSGCWTVDVSDEGPLRAAKLSSASTAPAADGNRSSALASTRGDVGVGEVGGSGVSAIPSATGALERSSAEEEEGATTVEEEVGREEEEEEEDVRLTSTCGSASVLMADVSISLGWGPETDGPSSMSAVTATACVGSLMTQRSDRQRILTACW